MSHFEADLVSFNVQGDEVLHSSHRLVSQTVFEAQREALALLSPAAAAVFIKAGEARLRFYRSGSASQRWNRA